MARDGNASKQAGLDQAKADDELRQRAEKISEDDVQRLVESEKDLRKRAAGVPGRFKRLVNQVRLLFEMARDYWNGTYREIPWSSITVAVAAVLYFIVPVDLIPDIIPVAGYLDDAMIVAAAVSFIQDDLKTYVGFKGYDPSQYFS